MPAQKGGKRKPARKNGKRGSSGKSFLGFLFSPPVILAILCMAAILLVIFFWPVITHFFQQLGEDMTAALSRLWLNTLQLLGLGVLLVFLALLALIVVIARPLWLVRYWNTWLGVIALAAAAWGGMAFIRPSSGVLAQATLGGYTGQAIITDSLVAGIFILLALVVIGIVLLAPRWSLNRVRQISASLADKLDDFIYGLKESRARKPEADIVEEEPILVEQPVDPVSPPDTGVMDRMRSSIVVGGWSLPNINILEKVAEAVISDAEIEKRKETIEEALTSYGVQGKVVEINRGPTVTQFGVEPGWDIRYREVREKDREGNTNTRQEEVQRTRVKVERISSLANDLALALAAPSIRIEAPIPGKSVVGIEVPNTTFGSVGLRGVMESTAFQKLLAKSTLALALGKGAGGETVVADLGKMPHLLLAGATGSGKSVCLNSIICCLVMNNTPDAVKFVMIDPKRVELVNFNSIPHLVAPVVVESEKAVLALRWLTLEMDSRYKRFSATKSRNIEEYNKHRQPSDYMPYIVVVIDELADLMMVAFDEVERSLCRLAQLARATGIHLIVATQRPSVDVVTGLIKANFPTRLTFALTSQVDSRTIIDSAGAEKLLGRGDMLYMPQDASKPKRLQGTMVSDPEIERLVTFWGNQRRSDAQAVHFDDLAQSGPDGKKPPEDDLLDKARQLAIESKDISASFLQRKLQIGFPRAARLMDKLKEEGFGKEKE